MLLVENSDQAVTTLHSSRAQHRYYCLTCTTGKNEVNVTNLFLQLLATSTVLYTAGPCLVPLPSVMKTLRRLQPTSLATG